jgi:hypothetical protein
MILKHSDASAFSADVVSSFTDTSGVTMDIVNTLTMNTHGLFYAMVNSIKQLDSTVTNLQKQLDACCTHRNSPIKDTNTAQGNTGNTIQVELANNAEIILYEKRFYRYTVFYT